MNITAALSLAGIGGVLGLILAVASYKLRVEVDPRIDEIAAILPGANCGACGFPGCPGYAEAIVTKNAPINACVPGKDEVAQRVAEIMGKDAGAVHMERKVARVICQGGTGIARNKYEYIGISDCHAAAAQFGGPKECAQACIGLGSCEKACPFGAIKIRENGLPEIDPEACTGCGICVETCPNCVLALIKGDQKVVVACRNKEKAKQAKASCQAACIKCKICEKNCPHGAIKVIGDSIGSIAVIDYDLCDNCGICVEKCPSKTIVMYEKACPEVIKKHNPRQTELGCAACGLCGKALANQ